MRQRKAAFFYNKVSNELVVGVYPDELDPNKPSVTLDIRYPNDNKPKLVVELPKIPLDSLTSNEYRGDKKYLMPESMLLAQVSVDPIVRSLLAVIVSKYGKESVLKEIAKFN